MNKSLSMQKQRGVATLVFSLVVLFTLTLTTVFGTRVSLLEEKMSSNDFRTKQSMMAAEAGLDVAIADIQSSATGDPAGPYTGIISSVDGVIQSYSAIATLEVNPDPESPTKIIKIVSTGCIGTTECSDPTGLEATSTIQQHVASIPLMGDAPAAPMVVTGGLNPQGGWQIVGKEGGTVECNTETLSGIEENECAHGLLSVWSEEYVEPFGGASASCSFTEYVFSVYDADGNPGYDDVYGETSNTPLCDTDHFGTGGAPTCYCANALSGKWSTGPYKTGPNAIEDGTIVTLTNSDRMSVDIVAPPVVTYPVQNFPTDLFAYVFRGIPRASYSIIKNAAATKGRVLANCDDIDENSAGLYWITGDCDLGEKVGTPSRPVLIVVEDAAINTISQMEGYGLLYAAEITAGPPYAEYKGNGGLWYGGIIVDSNNVKTAGGGTLVFSDGVFANLNKITAINFSAVPGTWKDF